MFKKLRNRLIIINVSITTVVITAVFATIYITSTHSANNRPPMQGMNATFYSDDVEDFIEITIHNEKQAAAQQLLTTLIVSGLVIEIAVALVSYYLAEEAIKPVREAYDAQKIFIANASHEIKTPLAAIAANLEAADIHGNHWISNVEKETEKLAALNRELLTLARTDLVTTRETSEVEIGALVKETAKSFNPRMKNLKFEEKILSSEKVKINREDFAQILSILLDNAVKYADTKIKLYADAHKLIISNDGAKISAEALPHIFERFYQADKTAEGVGLGLAIAQSLAERNHWKLTATTGKMTTFELQF